MRVNFVMAKGFHCSGIDAFNFHLISSFLECGHEVRLIKLHHRDELVDRTLEHYPVSYQNVSFPTLKAQCEEGVPTIISDWDNGNRETMQRVLELCYSGAVPIIHGAKHWRDLERARADWSRMGKIVTVRESLSQMRSEIPSVYIPQPYVRMPNGYGPEAYGHAAAVCILHYIKNIPIILEANERLPEDRKVGLFGIANRMYVHHVVRKYFPDFEPPRPEIPFRMKWRGARILKGHNFLVDMTTITGEGGGTQYAFMEAWDVGAVPVLHRDWTSVSGEMEENVNCLAAGSAEELSDLLSKDLSESYLQEIRDQGSGQLSRVHSSQVVVPMWEEIL